MGNRHVRDLENTAHEQEALRRKTPVVSKPAALRNRMRDRHKSCISQGQRVPREASEYRIDLLSTPAFRPGQLLRPRAGSKGSPRPPVTCAQSGFWEPMIGRVPPPMYCSDGINPARP